MTAQTAKFVKFQDFARRSTAYSVFIGSDKVGETYRTGRAWIIEDWNTGETYTADTRTEAVRALVQARTDAAFAAKVKAEVEREWEKIERLGNGRHTTAWHLIGSAEDNADDTSREEGFERHSDQWYLVLWSSYRLEEEYADYGELAYTRNIEDDIRDGLLEEL
ncbi:MAG: hypothetical protein HOY79_17800 [Streptomyces sp.]|nr:hypothetical protein [Streptomyces sp.]